MSDLVIDLRYPPSAFLYRATTPTVFIDSVEQPVGGWGRRRFEVASGAHQVQVHVPYVLPRRAGKAVMEVRMPPVGSLEIEYMAPTITFAKGALGAVGEQTSAGASAVRTANIVAVVVLLLAVVAIVAFG